MSHVNKKPETLELDRTCCRFTEVVGLWERSREAHNSFNLQSSLHYPAPQLEICVGMARASNHWLALLRVQFVVQPAQKTLLTRGLEQKHPHVWATLPLCTMYCIKNNKAWIETWNSMKPPWQCHVQRMVARKCAQLFWGNPSCQHPGGGEFHLDTSGITFSGGNHRKYMTYIEGSSIPK